MTTGHQCTIIATYSDVICVKIMATLKKTVNETYYWSIDRIYELCSRDDFEEVVNGDSLRQEFDEWINANNKDLDEEIISLAYIGEGSEYDI